MRDAPFLKIDTQGFEWQVLDGARDTLPHIKRDIGGVLSRALYDGAAFVAEVIDRLEAEGFSIVGIQAGVFRS